MTIRQLTSDDAAVYQELRLESLRDSPAAFGSSYATEANRTLSEIATRLQTTSESTVSVFGAFTEDRLVGICALARTNAEKSAHNATVCAMFVSSAFRRRRIGQALLDAIIAHARTFSHLRNLKLSVNTTNAPARRLYQARGFSSYGLEREALCVGGTFYDEELYALPLNPNAQSV